MCVCLDACVCVCVIVLTLFIKRHYEFDQYYPTVQYLPLDLGISPFDLQPLSDAAS